MLHPLGNRVQCRASLRSGRARFAGRDEPRRTPFGVSRHGFRARLERFHDGIDLAARVPEPLLNTLSVAFGAIVLSVIVGGTLAWLLARTDMFGRKWFATALIVPYMLPAWTFALAWTTLFKNRTVGGQAGWFESLGFTPPDWLSYGQFHKG